MRTSEENTTAILEAAGLADQVEMVDADDLTVIEHRVMKPRRIADIISGLERSDDRSKVMVGRELRKQRDACDPQKVAAVDLQIEEEIREWEAEFGPDFPGPVFYGPDGKRISSAEAAELRTLRKGTNP